MRVWLEHAEHYDEDPLPSRKHGKSPRRKWKTKARKTTPSPSWHTALPSFLIKTNKDSYKKAIAHQAIAFFVVGFRLTGSRGLKVLRVQRGWCGA